MTVVVGRLAMYPISSLQCKSVKMPKQRARWRGGDERRKSVNNAKVGKLREGIGKLGEGVGKLGERIVNYAKGS